MLLFYIEAKLRMRARANFGMHVEEGWESMKVGTSKQICGT